MQQSIQYIERTLINVIKPANNEKNIVKSLVIRYSLSNHDLVPCAGKLNH